MAGFVKKGSALQPLVKQGDFKADGSVPMTGPLVLNNQDIRGAVVVGGTGDKVRISPDYHAVGMVLEYNAQNEIVTTVPGPLDMGGHKIVSGDDMANVTIEGKDVDIVFGTSASLGTGFGGTEQKYILSAGENGVDIIGNLKATGNITLKGSGNYGNKINFGDGDYVHLHEISDDKLEIKATNLDLLVSGIAKYKSKEIVVKSTKVSSTISTTWVGSSAPYTQTLSVSGVTATNVVEVLLPSTATDEQAEQFQALGLRDGGQAAGTFTLKASGEKNAVAIPITVIIRGDL